MIGAALLLAVCLAGLASVARFDVRNRRALRRQGGSAGPADRRSALAAHAKRDARKRRARSWRGNAADPWPYG